jgi:hypothetical protein
MLDKLGRADGLFAYKQVRRTGGDETVQEFDNRGPALKNCGQPFSGEF